MINEFIKMDLHLFEGEGGESASGTGDGEASNQGGIDKEAFFTRKAKDPYANVKFGKQDAATEDGGAKGGVTEKALTPEDRQKKYQELINGEYKDLFTADTQRIIDKRFKESKQDKETITKQNKVLDVLMQKYSVNDLEALQSAIDNDDAMWEEAADDAGMTVSQFKQYKKLQRDSAELEKIRNQQATDKAANEQLQTWYAEADELKKTFPTFDLNTECQNPEFLNLLKVGVPMDHAYKTIHMDEILTEGMKTTAKVAEKRVADNIRAKGMRPIENGSSSASSFIVKNDVTKFTKADRNEAVRRALHGEYIEL